MDTKTLKILDQEPDIDKIATILIRLLHRAAADKQHGTVGINVTVFDGQFRKTEETIRVSHN